MKKVKIDWREIWKFEYTDKYKAAMKARIENGDFDYHITKCKYSLARVVEELIVNEIPFKVQSLGAGFKKIVAIDCICQNCKGSGIDKKK